MRFFLTLNSICRSEHLFDHLSSLHASGDSSVRENVLRFLAEWIAFSRAFLGHRTLDAISVFLQTVTSPLTAPVLRALSPPAPPSDADASLPPPIIDDPVKLLRPRLSLAEPRPEEVARQISLIVHRLFSAVHPREFYSAIANRALSLETPGLQELWQFGSRLKLLVAETLLSSSGDAERDRAALPKRMELVVEIARQLLELSNYEAVSWFVSAFEMKCIRRLRAREEIADAARETLEMVTGAYGWKRPSAKYNGALAHCYDDGRPAIPSVRYELAIVAGGAYGGAEFTDGAVNWGKRRRAADFIAVYHHFQMIPYRFQPIVQIQRMLERGARATKKTLNESSIQFDSAAPRE
jgi:hypothetical protein